VEIAHLTHRNSDSTVTEFSQWGQGKTRKNLLWRRSRLIFLMVLDLYSQEIRRQAALLIKDTKREKKEIRPKP
jgi:hypothetical protein